MAFRQRGCCSKLAFLHLATSHWLGNALLCQNLVWKQHMPFIWYKSVAERKTLWSQLHARPASFPSSSFILTLIFTHTLPLLCMHVLCLFLLMLQLSNHADCQNGCQSICAACGLVLISHADIQYHSILPHAKLPNSSALFNP